MLRDNIVHVGEKNGDDEVIFEEFKANIVQYLTVAFNPLDWNNDGSIDELLYNGSIKEYSSEVVEYFDNNEDPAISTEDYSSGGEQQEYDEGKILISELVGVNLINLPAPIYTGYTLLGKNQDETLTDFLEEYLKNGD